MITFEGHHQRPELLNARSFEGLQIHLGDKKLHAFRQIGRERFAGAFGYPVVVFGKPGLEPGGLLGTEDQNVVLANRKGVLDGDTERLRPGSGRLPGLIGSPSCRRCLLKAVHSRLARVCIEVFNQSGSAVGIDPFKDIGVSDLDLLFSQDGGDRYDHGKILHLTPVVVGHGEDGAGPVAGDDHLGALVEKRGIRLGNIKATEGQRCTTDHPQEEGDPDGLFARGSVHSGFLSTRSCAIYADDGRKRSRYATSLGSTASGVRRLFNDRSTDRGGTKKRAIYRLF